MPQSTFFQLFMLLGRVLSYSAIRLCRTAAASAMDVSHVGSSRSTWVICLGVLGRAGPCYGMLSYVGGPLKGLDITPVMTLEPPPLPIPPSPPMPSQGVPENSQICEDGPIRLLDGSWIGQQNCKQKSRNHTKSFQT